MYSFLHSIFRKHTQVRSQHFYKGEVGNDDGETERGAKGSEGRRSPSPVWGSG